MKQAVNKKILLASIAASVLMAGCAQKAQQEPDPVFYSENMVVSNENIAVSNENMVVSENTSPCPCNVERMHIDRVEVGEVVLSKPIPQRAVSQSTPGSEQRVVPAKPKKVAKAAPVNEIPPVEVKRKPEPPVEAVVPVQPEPVQVEEPQVVPVQPEPAQMEEPQVEAVQPEVTVPVPTPKPEPVPAVVVDEVVVDTVTLKEEPPLIVEEVPVKPEPAPCVEEPEEKGPTQAEIDAEKARLKAEMEALKAQQESLEAEKARIAKKKAEEKMCDEIKDWVAPEGTTLRTLLSQWGDESGWRVVWNMERDYTLEAGAVFRGRFVDVSAALLRSFARATPAPKGVFYKGNKVLVVSTREDENAD